MAKIRTVVVGVTGSIAAFRACDIVSGLRRGGFDVRVILTADGARFITPVTMRTISGNAVMDDMFGSPEEWDPLHVSVADKASCVLIAPATANIIGKIASGICDDLLTCVVTATKAPVVIAPAMNDNMYSNPIVRANIEKLGKAGFGFVGPVKGRLACGRDGMGHIADTDDIIAAVKRAAR